MTLLFGGDAGHGSSSLSRIRAEISRSRPDDYLQFDDWRILKHDLGIRFLVEYDGICCDPDDPDPGESPPYFFDYILYYFCLPLCRVRMSQVTHQLVAPVPKPMKDGLGVDGLSYDLARLSSQREEDVHRFLHEAGIQVVRERVGWFAWIAHARDAAWGVLVSALTRLRRRPGP